MDDINIDEIEFFELDDLYEEEIFFDFPAECVRCSEEYCKNCCFNISCAKTECIEKQIDDIINNILTPRDQHILSMYYGLGNHSKSPKTKAYISKEYNMSASRIDSILSSAIYKLKKSDCITKFLPLSYIVHNYPNSTYYKFFKRIDLFK